MNKSHKKILTLGFSCFLSAVNYASAPIELLQSILYFGAIPTAVKSKVPRRKWTLREDQRLQNLVAQYRTSNWNLIASFMFLRNARQCRERWENYLNPKINHSPWTPKEDALLEQKAREFGPKWAQIATFLPGRTAINCKNKYNELQRRNQRVQRQQIQTQSSFITSLGGDDDDNFFSEPF